MVDKILLTNFADAIRARPLIDELPVGLREHTQQFEKICLDDIRAQAENPDLTEQEVLDMIKPTLIDLVKKYLPVIADFAMAAIKKHYPAVTSATILSAVINHFLPTIQK